MSKVLVRDRQIEIYRRMAPWQRLEAACQLYALARHIIANRERRRAPQLAGKALEERVRSFFR